MKYKLNFFYIESILEFILSGFLDELKLSNDISSHFKKLDPKEDIINTLIHCDEIEETHLVDSLSDLQTHLAKGEYNIKRLPYIYTLLRYIEDQRYIEDWDIDVTNTLLHAFEKSCENGDNIPDSLSPYDRVTNRTFDDTKTKEKGYQRLNELVENKINSKESDNLRIKVIDFFEHLKSGGQLNWTLVQDFHQVSLFSSMVETECLQLLSELNNRGITVFEQIISGDILRVSNAGEHYYKQKVAFEKIIEYFKKNVLNTSIDKMRKRRVEDLIEYMNKAINHLETTRQN